jgi:hypothetical protein
MDCTSFHNILAKVDVEHALAVTFAFLGGQRLDETFRLVPHMVVRIPKKMVSGTVPADTTRVPVRSITHREGEQDRQTGARSTSQITDSREGMRIFSKKKIRRSS